MPNEMLFYLGNKALISNDKGEYLLLKVQKKEEFYWDLPGGRVNKGEEATAALIREVQEETGITQLTIKKHLGMAPTPITIPITSDIKGGLILSIYLCAAVIDRPLQAEEGVELVWCPASEVLGRIAQFPETLRQAIALQIDR